MKKAAVSKKSKSKDKVKRPGSGTSKKSGKSNKSKQTANDQSLAGVEQSALIDDPE